MDIKQRIDALLEGWSTLDTVTHTAVLLDARAEIERLEVIVERCHRGARRALDRGVPSDWHAALESTWEITTPAQPAGEDS